MREREKGFGCSAADAEVPGYNSLYDQDLRHYFDNRCEAISSCNSGRVVAAPPTAHSTASARAFEDVASSVSVRDGPTQPDPRFDALLGGRKSSSTRVASSTEKGGSLTRIRTNRSY